jgi:hypothetical protein
MARRCKDWLLLGSLPDDDRLCDQLALAGYHQTNGRLVIESKEAIQKRGEVSPDDSDALWLTFASAVAGPTTRKARPAPPRASRWG